MATVALPEVSFIRTSFKAIGRSGEFTEKSLLKIRKEGVQRFLERRFDWIALIVITLIILFSLVLF